MGKTCAVEGSIALLQACFPTLRVERHSALGEELAPLMLAVYEHPLDPTLLRRLGFYAGTEPFHETHFGQLSGDTDYLAHGIAWAKRQFTEA